MVICRMELFRKQNNYVLVVVTPSSPRTFIETPFGKNYYSSDYLRNLGCQFDFVFDNKRGLSEVYNEKLREYPEHRVIFVHDDVEIHDNMFLEKLDTAFLSYDVVGLAGGKMADFSRFDVKKQTLMWHLMSPQNELSGFVSHYFGNNQWNSSFFGMSPQRVVMIDGLFMAVDSKKCLINNVFFDEDFNFHYYDLAFSLRANAKNLKIGTYPIFVVHHGLGYVDNMNEFLLLQEKFYQKYSPKNQYD